MCKVCARSSPLRSTLNTRYIRFGHVSSMYRSSPLRSTLNTIVITHHSKSYIFPSKSKDLSPPAGSALFVRSTKTAGPRVFTMCQNIENHTDICKPWANYVHYQLVQDSLPSTVVLQRHFLLFMLFQILNLLDRWLEKT